MRLLVGCPVSNRNWVLPLWKEHLNEASPVGWEVVPVFVIDSSDEQAVEFAESWGAIYKLIDEVGYRSRDWDVNRYRHMVAIRNELLKLVREDDPDLFLSLDSDILVHPELITNLYETLSNNQADAVGGLAYLDQIDPRITNAAILSSSFFRRITSVGVFSADVLMAIKLMTPKAFHVDYQFHRWGEDFGWSKAARGRGCKLMFDSRVANKHLMSEYWLDKVDERVGF